MKKKQGFTLIELLVVVLIIGILTAIAVVQYQKSILKSKFSTLMPIAKALYEAEEVFAMSRGSYTDRLENLDVSATAGASGSEANINGNIIMLGVNNRHTYVKATKENFDNNLIMFQKGSKYFPGEIHCEAKKDNSLANWLCEKELGGEKLDRSLTEGYNDYVIKGDGNGFFPKDFTNVRGTSASRLPITSGDTCTGTETYNCIYLNVSDGSCYAQASAACARSTYTNSYCEGTERLGCGEGSKFYDSSCLGTKYGTCHGGTFYNSSCEGKGGLACAGSTYDNSVCIGNSSSACTMSTFKSGSICYAYVEGSCGDASNSEGTYNSTYEDTSCCSGQHCPSYVPKCDCAIDANTGQHAISC